MQEMQVRSQGWEYLLEKEMETHTSILAGKFRGQRNLAGYSPWGCKRVRHNLVTKQQQNIFYTLFFILLLNFLIKINGDYSTTEYRELPGI